MNRRAIASYLKRARVDAGYPTQAAFAKATGLSQQQISNYEKHGRVPQENIAKVARALNLAVEDLALLMAEAAEAEGAETRRERDKAAEERDRAFETIKMFVDKYEEFGHTYARVDARTEEIAAKADAAARRFEKQLAVIDSHLRAIGDRLSRLEERELRDRR